MTKNTMNFSNLTTAELVVARDALEAEINKRKEEEKEKCKAELEGLLDRINKLQDKYDFEISCYDKENGYWTTSISNLQLRE